MREREREMCVYVHMLSSVQGAWRQTAHWHAQGRVGKAVSPRRRVATQKP